MIQSLSLKVGLFLTRYWKAIEGDSFYVIGLTDQPICKIKNSEINIYIIQNLN